MTSIVSTTLSIPQLRADLAGPVIAPDDAGYDEGEASVRAAYPGSTWDRLAAIKARYDPTNLFRLNQNIPPWVEGSETS